MRCCTTGIDANSDETLSSNATAVIIDIVIIRKFLRVQGWCSCAGFEKSFGTASTKFTPDHEKGEIFEAIADSMAVAVAWPFEAAVSSSRRPSSCSSLQLHFAEISSPPRSACASTCP